MKKLIIIVGILLINNLAFSQNQGISAYNFGYERVSQSNILPDNWYIWPQSKGYNVKIDRQVKYKGRNAILIEPDEKAPVKSIGCVAQEIPNRFKGKNIELKAYLKLKDVSNGISLFLRIDGPSGNLQFANMGKAEIKGTKDWAVYSVQVPLPPTATVIYIGAILVGSGKLWVDDFQVLIDGKEIHQVKEIDTNFPFGKISTPTLTVLNDSTSKITKVPESFGFPTFYKKHLNVKGIPIVSSDKVPDAALYQARATILQMLEKIPQTAVLKIIQNNVRVAIMAKDELTTDIPEHSDLDKFYNKRARGLGATKERPAMSCAEENILCYKDDPYRGEDILMHEFAHTIHIMGINYIDKNFDYRLNQIYHEAIIAGLWKNTYAASNPNEYFAEGVQCWFNVNLEAISTNGIHNEINTRAELKLYNPKLYLLIREYFSEVDKKVSCQIITKTNNN